MYFLWFLVLCIGIVHLGLRDHQPEVALWERGTESMLKDHNVQLHGISLNPQIVTAVSHPHSNSAISLSSISFPLSITMASRFGRNGDRVLVSHSSGYLGMMPKKRRGRKNILSSEFWKVLCYYLINLCLYV